MSRVWTLGALSLGVILLTGCQPVASPLMGIIFNDTKFGYIATTNAAAPKEGKACAQTILGLVATGDASISAAKAAGGITEVAHIDYSAHSILGVVADFCTIVKGK
jgi:TRL (tRNA-associated locus)-like protein